MSLIIKFSEYIFKNKSTRKRNFIIYHFLIESKPHEKNSSIINNKREYLPDKKNWTGFELVKQNRFAKKSECSKEKRSEKSFGFGNHFMKNAKSFVN